IDLVDHHDVDPARLDVGHEPLEGRTLQVTPGVTAIVVTIRHQDPPLGLLARDIGLAGLALGVEGVELLLQTLIAGLAGVDRALPLVDNRLSHSCPRWLRSPKKIQPFQRVPVISRAMADSDLKGRPWYSKPSSRTVTECSAPCHSRRSRVPVIGLSWATRARLSAFPPIPSAKAARRSTVSGLSPP